MFQLILNAYNSLLNIFNTIQFNGHSIFAWCVAIFLLSAIVRFIFPLLGLHLGVGTLAGSTVASGIRASLSDADDNKVSKKSKKTYDTDEFADLAYKRGLRE